MAAAQARLGGAVRGVGAAQAATLAAEGAPIDTSEYDRKIRAQQILRERAQNEALTHIDASVSALARQEIDPNRLWSQMSTGDRIGAGIGVFFGALNQGFRMGRGQAPGENPMLQQLSHDIDRDLSVQLQTFQQGRQKLEEQRGLLATTAASYGDTIAGLTAAKAAYLERTAAMIRSRTTLAKSAEAKAEAERAAAALEVESAKYKQAAAERLAGTTAESRAEAFKPPTGGAAPRPTTIRGIPLGQLPR